VRLRRCPKGMTLHPRMHWKNGGYYHVKHNKWRKLSSDYYSALKQYAQVESSSDEWLNLVGQVFDRYEHRHKQGELAANTMKQYRAIRPRIEHGFGEFQVGQITTADVTTFLLLYENTPNMGNRMLSVLKTIFDRGVALGWCTANPARGVRRNDEKKRTRYLSDDEYRRIRIAASPVMKVAMDLCYLTGQRIGDVLSIRHADISPEGIAFRQQKTKQRMLVRMTPDIEGAVRDAKRLHKVMALWLLHPVGKSTPYSYTSIRDAWTLACKKARVTGATIHDIRAKAITDAQKQGKDPTALAGHTSKAMTDRYLRDRETMVADGPNLRQLLESLDRIDAK
jgi:integrase